jgi:tRNA isopentenyl-2-thiomethyl-A-37 hydroxylase MiaE
MESNEIFAYLARKIDEELGAFTRDLARGAAKDYGEYRYITGTIRGMLAAKEVIIETAERMEAGDGDD